MRTLLSAGLLLGSLASAEPAASERSSAEPFTLSDDQADTITAGGIRIWSSGSSGGTLSNAVRPTYGARSYHSGGVNQRLKMAPAGR